VDWLEQVTAEEYASKEVTGRQPKRRERNAPRSGEAGAGQERGTEVRLPRAIVKDVMATLAMTKVRSPWP